MDESEPSTITTKLSGTVAGSSIPDSRSATSARTASPMKNTSFPSAPVCQAITLVVGPSPDPTYQSMKADSIRISPEIQVSRWPQPQISSSDLVGRGWTGISQSSSSGPGGGWGSGVSTEEYSMGVRIIQETGTSPVPAGDCVGFRAAREAGKGGCP